MAKKRKRNTAKKKEQNKKLHLTAGASREIIAILLIMVSVFLVIAMLGVAGQLGVWVLMASKFIIGQAVYLLPLALLISAYLLFRTDEESGRGYKYNHFIGTLTFFIFFSTILEAILAPASPEIAEIGSYGGIVGYALFAVMSPVLNKPVALFILVMLCIVSLVIAANASLREVFAKIFGKNKDAEDDELEITGDQDIKVNTNLPFRGRIGSDSKEEEIVAKPAEPVTYAEDADWKYPSLSLLEAGSTKPDVGDVQANSKIISGTFKDFGHEVKMVGFNIGPTVSQYTLSPPSGVNLRQLTALDKNLSLVLGGTQVRIEAPIPGKSLVGIQVPNIKGAIVRAKDTFESEEYKKEKSKLNFALGRDVGGNLVNYSLDKAPHLLVAGATGKGKSVMINTLLVSLLYRNSPSELKLILVDPKHVEMTLYNDIPHLLTPVITEVSNIVPALKWAVDEMDNRLKLMAEHGARNIAEFNSHKDKDIDNLPYVVIVIDELADVMAKSGKDVDRLISLIAAKARAAGIHLVLATQTPRVNIITGTIKANIPARIAFTTTNNIDSQTILGTGGAEKLLGNGDMLFVSAEDGMPRRVQGVYVSNSEVTAVTSFLKDQRKPQYDPAILAASNSESGGGVGGGQETMTDELWQQAAEIVISNNKGSSSLLQRRLSVGYSRAAKIIDILEQKGVLGPQVGNKPREVIVSSLDDVIEVPEAPQ